MGDDSEKKKIDEEVPMIDVKDGKGAQLEGQRFFIITIHLATSQKADIRDTESESEL